MIHHPFAKVVILVFKDSVISFDQNIFIPFGAFLMW